MHFKTTYMKTFFVEIAFNNKDKFINHYRFLRGIVTAHDKAQAEQMVTDHFRPYYTAGDTGVFKVQCNWEVNIPTREIIEKRWKAATRSMGTIPINAPGYEMNIIGHRQFQLEETKEEVLANWDYCNCSWADPVVHYEPTKGGYVVSIHNYMALPSEFMFFKGTTNAVYRKALKWVKENTFAGDYYTTF